jgi:hypothetical protein
MQQIDWNKWLTLIAAVALISAILLPFVQKKYEERKAKNSFQMYLKKYFGILFQILTYDKIEYSIPSVSDNPQRLKLTLSEYISKFESDFKEHKSTIQFRIAFSIIFNLQNLLFVVHRIQIVIRQTDINKLYEQTLAYGNSLTKKELNKIYAILLIMENFISISSFHDRFGSMKSIERKTNKSDWTGLIINQESLKNQQLIFLDFQQMYKDESSLVEIINASKLLLQELKQFYTFEKLVKKKRK